MKSPFACCSKKIKDKLKEQKNEKLIKKFLTKNGLNEMS
jgi:hypothetical protein